MNLCEGGREAQCSGLQIRKTVGSNPTPHSKTMLGSSIGKDAALSRRKDEFDSRTEYQFFKRRSVMNSDKSDKMSGV
jgi:hypothetical protein